MPAWLNDVTLYHNRGDTTFVGENSLYGDFFGLDDLFTEHPRVVHGMIDIYKTWIADFGVDGFRIDTMKHVNDEFWQQFGPEVLALRPRARQARVLHVRRGLRHARRRFTSHFTTTDKMQAVLDFPFQAAAQRLRARVGADRRPARLLRRRRLVHRRRLERLSAADVPREPRHGPHRPLRPGGQPGRRGRRAARPRPAGARADVPLPRQPGRLLRRRAGLHRRRRRPGRAPGHVPEPGRDVQRRRPASAPTRRRPSPTSTRRTRCTARSASSPA